MIKIGVDLISGETGLDVTIQGCFDALEAAPDVEVVLIGDRDKYNPLIKPKPGTGFLHKKQLNRISQLSERMSVLDASEVITMDDDPLTAIKNKKDSSIVKGLQSHKRMEIDAFFSPGNTGAIVVGSALIMGRAAGIKKPALATFIPNKVGRANLLLDVGASAECDVKDLIRFAVMGRIFFREMMGVINPRVALLNIGSEAHKGTSLLKQTYKKMSEMDINFIGNIEGNNIFTEKADVIVCDGQQGNISLKVMEGASRTLMSLLKQVIVSNAMAKYSLPLYKNALKDLKKKVDPEIYGGAPLLGVRGNIFIGHGTSGPEAVMNGILKAADAVRKDILGKIHRRLEELNV